MNGRPRLLLLRRGLARLWLAACGALGLFFLLAPPPASPPSVTLDGAVQAAVATRPPSARTRPIESLRAGDRIWAYDPGAGTWSIRPVVRPLVHAYRGDLIVVEVAGQTIQATANHPFWVADGLDLAGRPAVADVPAGEQATAKATGAGRWVEARHLREGDQLVMRSGQTASVANLRVQHLEGPVYNLEVQGLHTYAVSHAGVVVHNKVPPPEFEGMGGNAVPSTYTGYRVMSEQEYQMAKQGIWADSTITDRPGHKWFWADMESAQNWQDFLAQYEPRGVIAEVQIRNSPTPVELLQHVSPDGAAFAPEIGNLGPARAAGH